MEDSVPYSSMKEISPVVGCWDVVGAGSLSPGVAQHFRGLQQHCLIRIVLLEGSQLLLQVRRGFFFSFLSFFFLSSPSEEHSPWGERSFWLTHVQAGIDVTRLETFFPSLCIGEIALVSRVPLLPRCCCVHTTRPWVQKARLIGTHWSLQREQE